MDGIRVSHPPSVPQIPPHYLIYRGCGELSPSPAPFATNYPKKPKKKTSNGYVFCSLHKLMKQLFGIY
jgi:hypothetical protein